MKHFLPSYVDIRKPGLLTTVQDSGRHAFQHLGISVGGAMDSFSLQIANTLVGNTPHAAALELTWTGPELLLARDTWIAICGGEIKALVQDKALPMWRPVFVRAGTLIRFGTIVRGCRSYIAFDGGIEVPSVLGGQSTHLRAAFGGFQGRALQADDRLELGKPNGYPIKLDEFNEFKSVNWYAPEGWFDRLNYMGEVGKGMDKEFVVRVIPGPEYASFDEESQRNLEEFPFTVGAQSDRMGLRLTGPQLRSTVVNMHSQAVTIGTVQVTPDGSPIVLMADRQTTGGYPRIAQIAAVDLSVMAQRSPGDTIWFTGITLDEAEHLLWSRDKQFNMFQRAVKEAMKRSQLRNEVD